MGLSNVRLEEGAGRRLGLQGRDGHGRRAGDDGLVVRRRPGTPAEGISGEVVYVGAGSKDEFDAAGDVTGKIVLIDTIFEEYWINLQCGEATQRGATAVIIDLRTDLGALVPGRPQGPGSQRRRVRPLLRAGRLRPRADGDALKKQLKAGTVDATVKSDSPSRWPKTAAPATTSSPNFPAASDDGDMVVIGGHHDAHFRAGADDTGAVSATLTLAKAMTMSGYKPKRTIVFFFDTAEEYGYTDCYFDWIIGAWYAITHEHTDWPGKAVAYINLEVDGREGRLGRRRRRRPSSLRS